MNKLISPSWLHEHPNRNYLMFEVGSEASSLYRAGHIPGAMYLDTNVFERPPAWNRLPDKDLAHALVAHGIAHDKTVILYGRGSSAPARVAVILLYAGVSDVRLVDGGFHAWVTAGFPVEAGERLPEPVSMFGISLPARPEIFVGMETVKKILAEHRGLIVSIQSWAEYIGETSGYDFIQPKGRIAGSVWGHAGVDKDHMDDFRKQDGTARPLKEIAEVWRGAGITQEKQVVFYCGTGWRASEAFFYAYAMGWKSIAVYDGGWLEWSSNPVNPVEKGSGH